MGKRLHVLHVHSGNLFGGVETILMTLVRLRETCPDLRTEFALCFEDRLSRELTENGAPVHFLGEVRVSRPWTILRARRAMRDRLRHQLPDLIVFHSAWAHSLFAPVVRKFRLPVVWWLHNRATGKHWTERWARLTKPDLMLCVSQDTATTAERLFRDVPKEVIYAPMPMRPTSFSAAEREAVRAELGAPAGSVVIVQVSRMEAWKGHVVHLKALAELSDLPGWVCWQVGGPHRPEEVPYFEQVQAMARDLGLADRVHFLGRRSDVPRLLAAADLFCQPNLDAEGLGIVFVEALLAGLPVITSALGGAVELVDASCGLLMPVGDVTAVARSLRELIVDPGRRRALGAAGPGRVEQLCHPVRQMQKIKELFERVAVCPQA